MPYISGLFLASGKLQYVMHLKFKINVEQSATYEASSIVRGFRPPFFFWGGGGWRFISIREGGGDSLAYERGVEIHYV